MAVYTVRIRDRRTREVLGEVPVYQNLTYRRRDVEAGSFFLQIHKDSLPPSFRAPGRLLEVRRDGAYEFEGIIEDVRIEEPSGIRILEGRDLKAHFLESRIAGRTSEETVTGDAGETAMKGYVDASGGPSAAAERRFGTYLDVPFTIEADGAQGDPVDFTALRRNLLTEVLAPIARRAGLWHDVIGGTGYEYQVYEVTQAGTLFSIAYDTAAEIDLRESIARVPNAVTVLGAGSGPTRDTREVVNADHANAYWRTEAMLDDRDSTTNDELDEAGATYIADAIRRGINASVQPFLGNIVGGRYRADWDIGQIVTVAIAEEGIAVERLVVGVDVTLQRSGLDEQIMMQLGDVPPTDLVIIAREILRSRRASYE